MAFRRAAFLAFLSMLLCCALLPGCGGKTRPELVLAARPEAGLPSPSATPSKAEDGPKSAAQPDGASATPAPKEAWFFLSPAEGNTTYRGGFETNLPEGAAVFAQLCIAPLGGPVTLTDTLSVDGGYLSYDFSAFMPRSAIDRQYAVLTLSLRFADPQPQELTDAFGETGETLVEGFVTQKAISSRVEMTFALPFPDADAVAGLEPPCFSNPSDLVFATSTRYHRQSCRYSASAKPVARAYAQHLGLSPCALCGP